MRNDSNIFYRDENGYIVVETIGAFVPFVFLVISILSLVNIAAVQARIHYALTQAANTLSVYSYTLDLIGMSNNLTTLDNKANRVAKDINALKSDVGAVISGLDSFSNVSGAIGSGTNAASRIYGWGEEAAGDPKAALQLMMNFGLNEFRNSAFEVLARPLVGRYLGNDDMTGDEYLTRAGVVNRHTGTTGLDALEFYQLSNLGLGNSVLIDKNGDVKLVVEYEILYRFGALPLPFNPTLRITQTAVTKAWLNGSGKGYW